MQEPAMSPDPAEEPSGHDTGAASEGTDGSAASIDQLLAQLEAEMNEGTTVEDIVRGLVDDLDRTAAERDEYLDGLRRMKAEFENYRKRTGKEMQTAVDRAAENFVVALLPVLDACDQAVAHGDEAAAPISAALQTALAGQGLERIDPLGAPFDPELHEAVAHEPGDDDENIVAEVMRPGYAWNGRVLRAAMVKVRG